MTTALASLPRPVIIATGERSNYRLASDSAAAFTGGLASVFELLQELTELTNELSCELTNEKILESDQGFLRLLFSPYHGFTLASVKGSEKLKRIVIQANADLISSKWQC